MRIGLVLQEMSHWNLYILESLTENLEVVSWACVTVVECFDTSEEDRNEMVAH